MQGSSRTSFAEEFDEQPNRPAEQPNPYQRYPAAPSGTDTPQAARELRAGEKGFRFGGESTARS
jgi:hypothetical protein